MKYPIVIVTTIALIVPFALSGCDNSHPDRMGNAETSQIETNHDMEIAKSEVESEVRMYRAENEDRIVEYNRTIGDIKQRINNESDSEVRAELENKLEEYEATHRELKREMDNYKVTGRDNWDGFKDNFSSRMDDLGDSLDDFFSTDETVSSTNLR